MVTCIPFLSSRDKKMALVEYSSLADAVNALIVSLLSYVLH